MNVLRIIGNSLRNLLCLHHIYTKWVSNCLVSLAIDKGVTTDKLKMKRYCPTAGTYNKVILQHCSNSSVVQFVSFPLQKENKIHDKHIVFVNTDIILQT